MASSKPIRELSARAPSSFGEGSGGRTSVKRIIMMGVGAVVLVGFMAATGKAAEVSAKGQDVVRLTSNPEQKADPYLTSNPMLDAGAATAAKAAVTVDTVSLCPNRAPSAVGTFTSFDPPGSQGTTAVAINPFDTVTGDYADANGNIHGFVRSVLGQIISFDADTAPAGISQETAVLGINALGEVTGWYFDGTGASYGFVRSGIGKITLFNAPDADVLLSGTTPTAIRDDGTVTGNYQDVNGVFHGFVRARNGVITSFDAPEAGTGSNDGTFPAALNAKGTIVGCYANAANDFIFPLGFIETGDNFSALTPPGSTSLAPFCASFLNSLPSLAINPEGVISGAYYQPVDNALDRNYRGFVRATNGTYNTFDAVPSPSSPCCTWTFPTALSSQGTVVGFENDFCNENHAFLRAANGTITLFDAPASGPSGGTIASGINPLGVVTGTYSDANFVNHGFLFAPKGGE